MLGAYLALIDNEPQKKQFESLYIAFKNMMYNTAYSITHDVQLAEDAVMDSFFVLAKNMDKMTDMSMSNSRNYLIMIVRNKAIDIYNKQKNSPIIEEELDNIPDMHDTAMDIEDKDNQQKLFGIIKSLDKRYSDVLVMKYFYGLKTSEIAKDLGLSANTVSSRITRAKQMLRIKLKEEAVI